MKINGQRTRLGLPSLVNEHREGRTHHWWILAGMVYIDPTDFGLYNNVYNDAVYRKISYHGLVITRGPALYISQRFCQPCIS